MELFDHVVLWFQLKADVGFVIVRSTSAAGGWIAVIVQIEKEETVKRKRPGTVCKR